MTLQDVSINPISSSEPRVQLLFIIALFLFIHNTDDAGILFRLSQLLACLTQPLTKRLSNTGVGSRVPYL
jgi:hypothetical protein